MPDSYFTIGDAAKLLRIPYWKLNRAVKSGLIPHYKLFNRRKLVLISDIQSAMAQHSVKGD